MNFKTVDGTVEVVNVDHIVRMYPDNETDIERTRVQLSTGEHVTYEGRYTTNAALFRRALLPAD